MSPDRHPTSKENLVMTNTFKTVTSAALLLGLSGAASAEAATAKAGAGKAATCQEVTQAQLDAQFNAFNQAWSTGNPDVVTALFDDDAVLLATVAARPRTNHEGIRAYFVDFLKNKPVGTIETSTIKSGCGWAVRAGTWNVAMTNAETGVKSDVKARYTFVYEYEDGAWEIAHLHSSVLPAKQ
jgi:uncharacterized protein (TIGR02246 family)